MKRNMVFLCLLFSITIVNAQWQKTNGPVGVGSSFFCAVKDTTLFAFSSGGEVYASNDSGNNWKIIKKDWEIIVGASKFEIIGNTILINAVGGKNTSQKGGIYSSTDNGETWISITSGLDFQNGNDFYLDGSNIFFVSNNGLYLSTNYGNNWIQKYEGLTNSVLVNDQNVFLGTSEGMFISPDYGVNWAAKNDGITSFSKSIVGICKNDTTIFAVTRGTNLGSLYFPPIIYRSTNNGVFWTDISSGFIEGTIGRNFTIHNSKIYCWTEYALYMSSDNGNKWEIINTDLVQKSRIVNLAFDGNNVFASTEISGVFLSTDEGYSWAQKSNGFKTLNVNELAIDGNNIFTGNAPTSVSLTTDDGNTWENFGQGLPKYAIIKNIAVDGNYIFIGQPLGNGVYMSSNRGNNWILSPGGLPPMNNIYDISIMKGNVLLSSSSGTYISTDKGESWVQSLVDNSAVISAFVINGDNIYSQSNQGLFISNDNGFNWSRIDTNKWNISAVAINKGNIYVSEKKTSSDSTRHIFLSTDYGSNWDTLCTILSYYNINQILIYKNNIFIRTAAMDGLYISTDSGVSWNKRNGGLPSFQIWDLKIKDDEIYAAINCAGIYKAKLEDIITDVREENAQLEHSTAYLQYTNTYPIPASDIVRSTVYWNSAYNIMDAQIDIYNMYGMKQNNPEISIEKQADYKANIVWNCSGYSAGVYFIRITLGGETMAVPVLINRGN